MNPQTAESLIRDGMPPGAVSWADLGAGSGVFTLALQRLLEEGRIYALDKSPHLLWSLPRKSGVSLTVVEADFTRPFTMPQVQGMVMANALHYAVDPATVLPLVLEHLAPGGTLILVEYETRRPNPPWVPYPLPFAAFQALAARFGLPEPRLLAQVPSQYGYEQIYSAVCAGIQRIPSAGR